LFNLFNKSKSNTSKIVFLGSSSVGKTSILRKVNGQAFMAGYTETLGINYSTTRLPQMGEVIIKSLFYDISGKIATDSNKRKKLLIDVDCIIFVFDLTRYESFLQISRMINEIQTDVLKNKIPVVILGNKSDLDNREVYDNEVEDLIKYLQSDKNTKFSIVEYIETSAKTGSNIEIFLPKLSNLIISERKK